MRWIKLIFGLAIITTVALPASAPAQPAPKPPQPQQAQQPSPAPPARFVVVLDAAHGGDDAGASLNGQQEKAITLALSVRLRSLLNARGIYAFTTREADTAVEPNRRIEVANRANAQACLSLHAAISGSGVHLFASSLAPGTPTRLPAWKSAQAAFIPRSLELMSTVKSALEHAALDVTMGRAGLPVVDSMACPAIAVEIAPEKQPGKDQIPVDDAGYQTRIADAIAAALMEWRAGGQKP